MYFIKVRLDRNLEELQHKMRRVMGEMANYRRPVISRTDMGWTPETDLYETGNEIFLEVNLAGVKREDIEVSFCDKFLRIAGRRTGTDQTETVTRYHQLEIDRGNFERVFRLPTEIDEDQVQASYADGLLIIKIKKKKVPKSVYVKINP